MDVRFLDAVHDAPTLQSVCFQYPDGSGGNITTCDSAAARIGAPDLDRVAGLVDARTIVLAAPEVPSPLNLWMNIPVKPDGSIGWEKPVSRPGDYVLLKAEMDCVIAMSACPQDIVCINANSPTEAHYELLA